MAAEQALAGGAEAFPHIRIVQHPAQYRLYAVHLAWVGPCC